jgi:hypothetical protein
MGPEKMDLEEKKEGKRGKRGKKTVRNTWERRPGAYGNRPRKLKVLQREIETKWLQVFGD